MLRCLIVLAFFGQCGRPTNIASSPVLTAVYQDRIHLCSGSEFSCADGACVSLDRRCDGARDCADGSDEDTCARSSNSLELHELVLHRHRRQAKCRKNQWRCRDGSCIQFDGKCDGVVDCPDGSDETHPLCRNMRCQSNLFRCTYGACVDGTAPCNGAQECADGSDELLPQCTNTTSVVRGKFVCKDGSKIQSTDLCDGVKNCADGSDETLEACAGRRCAPYLFQCAYGACVDADAECDAEGVQHCADGSDESDELCNRTSTGDTNTPSSTRCELPPFPEHGSYSVAGRPGAKPGQKFDSVTLSVTCEPPYQPDGTDQPHCSNGRWYAPVPECKRFCKLTQHPSVTYSCKPTDPNILSGDRRCNEYEPSGTEVHPSCNANYYHSGVLSYMYCIDGFWDHVATCEPECGTLTPNGVPLVINGVSAKRGELPWHTGIYDKRFAPFMQICGGSLASTTVVISAAHCFWNDVERVLPAKYFAVGVGKIYRPWNIEEGGQKSDVSDIKIPPRFSGAGSNFQDDIALIILVTPIVLANYIRPVCIDFGVKFDESQLQPGKVGKVAGWGLTSEDGNASQVLKVTELPYVDVEQCIADLPFDFRSYITSDKICAGSKTGTALCKGDSGGGLVFPEVDRGVQRWYLRGVVSTAPSNGHKCNSNAYTSFTQLLKHDDFVRKHLNNRRFAVSWISVVSAAGDGRSDRIVSLSSEGCPTGKWRCENGLCVAATAVCDGEFQCEDGSDEALILCRGTTRPLFGLMLHCSQTWSSNYDTVCPEACRRWPQYCYYVLAGDHGVPGVCTFPEFPRVGTYDIDDIVLRPGGVSADFSLVYSCPLNYTLEGSSPRCVKGTWVGNTPTCQIYCKLPRHPSVTYWCKLTDPSTLRSERQCDEYEPNGSVVLPKCNDNIINHRDLSHMHCIDGSWDYVAICAPECGTVMPQGEQLKRDVSAKHGELPWHTLIYDKRFAPFMQICGGSLASTTVVISAAHCFWNDWEGVLPAKNFAVGVGKIYRSWNIEDGGQKSNVTDIKVPPRFSGAGSNFQDDIALIILMTPVVLTNYVRPVCIDFGVLFDKRQLQPGNIGKVASWGLTSEDGDASQVLKVTELPYVDVEQCIADFPFDFRLYITSDKICAGSKTGPALCKGDSGGGLVFPEVDRGVQRWYLRGVVSTAPSNGHKCNSNVYSSFTQLLKHDDFVRKHLNNRR